METVTLALLFYIIAAVCFAVQAAGKAVGSVNLLGLGLVFVTLGLIFD